MSLGRDGDFNGADCPLEQLRAGTDRYMEQRARQQLSAGTLAA